MKFVLPLLLAARIWASKGRVQVMELSALTGRVQIADALGIIHELSFDVEGGCWGTWCPKGGP
jgi:hypothetical protein